MIAEIVALGKGASGEGKAVKTISILADLKDPEVGERTV